MSLNSSSPTLELVSIDSSRRAGIYLVGAIIAVGWLFCLSWAIGAAELMQDAPPWSLFIFTCDLAFGVYLSVRTVRYIRRTFNRHRIEITDQILIYSETDSITRQTNWARIDLGHVRLAEYSAHRGSPTLTLKGNNGGLLELPLWSFPQGGKELLHFLQSHGIKTVTLTLDNDID